MDGCERARYDMHWCAVHQDDFLDGALSCESIARSDAPRGRPRGQQFPVTVADLRSETLGTCPYCGEQHRWLVA